MRAGAVQIRPQVRTARHAEARELTQQLRNVLLVERREHHGQAARQLDRAHVLDAQRQLHLGRLALRRALHRVLAPDLGGRHPDQGPLAGRAHASTHVSLPPPFWLELTTSAPGSRAKRVSPPGSARGPSAVQNTNARRSTWRGSSAAAADRRRRGQGDRLLCDDPLRLGDDEPPRPLPVLRLRVGAHDHAGAAEPLARLHDQLLDPLQHRPAVLRLARVVGAHGPHERLLAQIEAHHLLDVRMRQLVVGGPGAEAVHAGDAAAAQRLEQRLAEPGGPAVRAAQPALVGAPVDDADLDLTPAAEQRPHPPAPLIQLLREDQGDLQQPGELPVLPPRAVPRAVGEQHHLAVAPVGSGGPQHAEHQVAQLGADLVSRRRNERQAEVADAARRRRVHRRPTECAGCPRAPASHRRPRAPRRSRRRAGEPGADGRARPAPAGERRAATAARPPRR